MSVAGFWAFWMDSQSTSSEELTRCGVPTAGLALAIAWSWSVAARLISSAPPGQFVPSRTNVPESRVFLTV